MLFDPKYEPLDALEEHLRRAHAITTDLISNVIADACTRLPVMKRAGKAAQIDQLIEAGAWDDAAFALIELELPPWKLRRLVYEDGEWLCSLSRQPNLPVALDDTADASHEVMPLAILSAFVEARRRASAMGGTSLQTVPRTRATSGHAVCCDNFSLAFAVAEVVMPKWWVMMPGWWWSALGCVLGTGLGMLVVSATT